MAKKKYEPKEKKLPEAAEPVMPYNSTTDRSGLASLSPNQIPNEKPVWFDTQYAKLKSKADKIYGTGERMSVDDYFGKLWYIVEGLYEHL